MSKKHLGIGLMAVAILAVGTLSVRSLLKSGMVRNSELGAAAADYSAGDTPAFSYSIPILPQSEVVNVQTSGAKGDGTTDDSGAINSAIASACSGNHVVYIPPASSFYVIDSPIVLPCTGLILESSGTAATLDYNGTSGAGITTTFANTYPGVQVSGVNVKLENSNTACFDWGFVYSTLSSSSCDMTKAGLKNVTGMILEGATGDGTVLSTGSYYDSIYGFSVQGGIAATDPSPVASCTAGSPTSCTITNHGFSNGDTVMFRGATGSWTPLNAANSTNGYAIFPVTVTDANTITIPLDSTHFGSFTGNVYASNQYEVGVRFTGGSSTTNEFIGGRVGETNIAFENIMGDQNRLVNPTTEDCLFVCYVINNPLSKTGATNTQIYNAYVEDDDIQPPSTIFLMGPNSSSTAVVFPYITGSKTAPQKIDVGHGNSYTTASNASSFFQ